MNDNELPLNSGVSIGVLPTAVRAMLVASEFKRVPRTVLWLVEDADEMYQIAQDLGCFLDASNIECLLAPDVRPYQNDNPSQEVLAARIGVMHRLLGGKPFILIAPVEAVIPHTLPPAELDAACVRIQANQELDREGLAARLVRMGYTREALIDDVGQFSIRGFVMDIFSPGMEDPVRIDLFGDTVEHIKTFTLSSQRSRKELQYTDILPASEVILFPENIRQARPRLRRMKGEVAAYLIQDIEQGIYTPGIQAWLPCFYETPATIFDYLPHGALAIAPDTAALEDLWEGLYSRYERAFTKSENSVNLLKPDELLITQAGLKSKLTALPGISTSIAGGAPEFAWREIAREATADGALDKIEELASEGLAVYLCIGSTMLAERISYALSQRGHNLAAPRSTVLEGALKHGIHLVNKPLSSGFIMPSQALAVIAGEELFGSKRQKKAVKRQPILNPFTQLNVGDAIVHRDNGIGIFKGIERIDMDGVRSDFVILEYLGGDKLYVPVYRLSLLQRYVGETDSLNIDKLGGTRWVKATAAARESAKKLAGELLAIYAKRESAKGFSFDVATTSIKEFEDDFPYEETDDQLRAIEDMYADMASQRPMDRLICGDVGYGKTEVALRAAFVAAMSGKQAAVLVPTTLLARQHLNTFRSRFEPWPIRVEGVSGFATAAANKEVLQNVKAGIVDVVIGTQALLSDKTGFKDLGLLVVDEEHRFGVKDKERVKAMRAEVDILTLTATPIPRTLNMAISGIRDMSIIETPPVDRKSIETEVSRFDDDAITQAIERELARGGQVYFVHNQVANIDYMADYIQQLYPPARIGVAHGQMNRKDLDKVMEKFLDRRVNVLVCSTIIGAGIDISTANTIIINRADKFGLADLYQMRGRVGRSKIKGHALLLIPAVGQITKDARKRLAAIKEYESLGAGFQMAMRDMEIRGVGDILGHAQWGQVTAIGFELYQQMLNDAVNALQGKPVQAELDPEIRIGMDAYIPDEYCPDGHLRLGLYKRLAGAAPEELQRIHDELIDMYGPIPKPVRALLGIAELRERMKTLRVRKLEYSENVLRLYFAHDSMVNIDSLLSMAMKKGGRLTPEGMLAVPLAHDIRAMLAVLDTLVQAPGSTEDTKT